MRIPKNLLAIGVVLLLLCPSTPVSAEPAPLGDMGLQAAGALAGQTVGSLLGMLVSFPAFAHSLSACEEVSEPSQAPNPDEAFGQLQRCMVRAAVPLMFVGSGLGMGSGLGVVAGLVATAELQGRDGSALGAIGGVFAAQSLMYFLSAQQTADYFAAAGLDDQSGEEAEPSRFDGDALVGMQLASASLVLLPVIAGVLGYNFL